MPSPNDRCFAYPLRVAANGGLELASGDAITQDRIRSVIETRPREMVMRPNYGLSDQAFTAIYAPGVIGERVRQAVKMQVPGITPQVLATDDPQSGTIALRINWADDSQSGGQEALGAFGQGGDGGVESANEIRYEISR